MQMLVVGLLATSSACYRGLDATSGAGSEGGDESGSSSSGADADACELDGLELQPTRRLTRSEYANTVRDLFGVTLTSTDDLPMDEGVGGYESNTVAQVSSAGVEAYMAAAEEVAAAVELAQFLPCALQQPDEACRDALLQDFVRRAFRRPPTPTETDALRELFDEAEATAGFEAAVRLVIEAVLQSGSFLYRAELGDDGGNGHLSSYELATRLAYFVWGSGPDDELLEAAALGELDTEAGIAAQAERLLADVRAADANRSFFAQWLGIARLDTVGKDAVLYPQFTPTLRAAMREETLAFVAAVQAGEQPAFARLLTSPQSYIDDELAALYGVPPSGSWRWVELPEGQRTGLLTHASVLAALANADQQSPILRGKFIRTRLLCQAIPPPPPDVDLVPPEVDPTVPTRERFDQHRADPSCAGCHSLMDPLGYAFLHYDAIGAWQALDGGLPVDASAEVLGSATLDGTYDGAIELAAAMAESPEVMACFAKQQYRFALGRLEREAEACAVEEIAQQFVDSGGDTRALEIAIATSPAFRTLGSPP